MARQRTPWWLVSILKGGGKKTTTAMFLAFACAARGDDVLLVDADYGTQGVTDWATQVYADAAPNDPEAEEQAEEIPELPFDVIQWAPHVGLLVPFIQAAQRRTGAKRVIIDIGGEAPEVLEQAVINSTHVISPVAPERGETGRLSATRAIVEPTGVPHTVVLARVPARGQGSARKARSDLTAAGYTVAQTEIERNLALYSEVWGSLVQDLGHYADLAEELLKGDQ